MVSSKKKLTIASFTEHTGGGGAPFICGCMIEKVSVCTYMTQKAERIASLSVLTECC